MPNWCTGEVVGRKVWTEGLFTIRVRVPEVKPFLPGQFLQLGVIAPTTNGHDEQTDGSPEKIKRINRPYSVASPHGDELEFFIVLVPDGELTPRLWAMQEGDSIEVSDAGAGSFTLKKAPPAETLWLVATGTGLAPYIAMLRTDQPWEEYKNIVVVQGVRHFADLAYTEELISYQQKYPGRFHLTQTLTREKAAGTLAGRIPALFENGQLESQTGIKCGPDNSTVLLCGNPAMLDSMEELLETREMKKHRSKSPGQIVLERYW